MSLFDSPAAHADEVNLSRPLAERMRPRTLDEYVGQEHLLSPGKPLRNQIERDQLGSMIFWGPPGVGKTTLAKLIARRSNSEFVAFSGVLSSIKEVKQVMADAERLRSTGRRTLVFIDEIHRFNKAQQDAFLPYVERGDIVLIGATTENPSFEVISALLSRSKVYVLHELSHTHIETILRRALEDSERGLGDRGLKISDEALERIAVLANGDGRNALQTLETAALSSETGEIDEKLVSDVLQRKTLRYDKTGEEHYNVISALHKSIRSSDVDATLYWLTRMLDAGEDRLFIGRRLVRIASEDIGLADPRALEQALAAVEAFRLIGEPEGDLALAQAAVYLALAPKSDALYKALASAEKDVQHTIGEPVPLHLRNAPTKLMKDIGYGHGYEHAHNRPGAVVDMECLPSSLVGRQYYHPSDRGVEQRIQDRLADLRRKRAKPNEE
ncbi:MAG: replication-associated recombination protein A [Bryobacterales bacterium]